MKQESWAEYVRRVTAGMSQNLVAEKTGVAQTNIGRWLRGDTGAPRAENVIGFARALGLEPLEALVAAGYLELGDIRGGITVHRRMNTTRPVQSRRRAVL